MSIAVPLPALVAHLSADLISVEIVSDCALGADFLFPFRTAVVGRGVRSEHAAAVSGDSIPTIAILTYAHIRVVLLTKLVDVAAHPLLVEYITQGTLHTVTLHPRLAAEVVTNQLQKIGIVEFVTEIRQGLLREDL